MKTLAGLRIQDNPLLLVSRSHPLPLCAPPKLAPADPLYPCVKLERQAAVMLRACIYAAGGQNKILPVSGWRSQAEQQEIWDNTLFAEGEEFTQKYVAYPGCSEHQTGLAIDLAAAAEKIDFIRPEFPFDGVCGVFRRRAAEYGFIQRYPAGKESITGIACEPWHFRYVGVPHAQIMEKSALTLEEYLEFLREEHQRRPLKIQSGLHEVSIQYHLEEEFHSLSAKGRCQISQDNCGGFIITRWR